MRRLSFMVLFLLANASLRASAIDSLYNVFLASKGDQMVRIANEIAELVDDTVCFTSAMAVDEVKESVLKKLIFWHFDRNEMTEVVGYAKKAIESYEKRGDLFDAAGCYNLLGVAYQRLGQMNEAIDSYNKCNDNMALLNEQEPNPFYEKNIRYTTNNMANIYSSMGENDMAVEMFKRCVDMMGELQEDDDYLDMATYLHNLADVYLTQAEGMEGEPRKEKVEKAVELMEQAYDYSVNHGDRTTKVIQRKIVLSRAYFANGRADDAVNLLNEALQMAKDEEDRFRETEIENLFGEFAFKQGDYKDSEAHYQNAIALAKENDYDEILRLAFQGAYEASRMFDSDKALGYLEQSVAYKDSIFNEKQQALIRDYQVKYDMAQMEYELDIEQRNNKLKAREILALILLSGLLVAIVVILVRLVRSKKKQGEILERLNQTQQRILSVASHDVKTSVLAQNMVLKMVNEHYENLDHEELKGNLAMLKKSSDELKDKLYNILHWISGEMGKEAVPSEEFTLSDFIDKGISLHAEELKYKKLNVENDIPKSCECFDKKNVVDIVFQNLFSNAIKFTPQGGTIKVSSIDDGDKVWAEVADTGIGISQERLQQLTHDTVTPSQGTQGELGSGIGLFVCRQLMVKNGGQLIIESVEGQGTSIRFNINKAKK